MLFVCLCFVIVSYLILTTISEVAAITTISQMEKLRPREVT